MTNITNATTTAKAVGQAYDNQPGWLRFKGTIIIVLTGLVSICSQLAALPEWDGTTVGVGFTIAATVIGALINRFTKDGFTESMISRAARESPEDAPAPVENLVPQFPAVDPALDYGTYMADLTPPGYEYEGQHRAE